MFKKYQNPDLARLDGKRFAFNLDGMMTSLSFIILFIVVIIPIFMIIYNAFFFEGKFDLQLFKYPPRPESIKSQATAPKKGGNMYGMVKRRRIKPFSGISLLPKSHA